MRSNRPGLRLCLRVVFPNQKDPKTGETLWTLVEGKTEYKRPDTWQELECETTDKTMQNHIRLLRYEYQPNALDTRGSYVDQVFVKCSLGPGKTEIFLDEPRVGPLVSVTPVSVVRSEEPQPAQPPAEIRQGQLEIGGRPRLTTLLIDHGEHLATFKLLHANTVLLPDVDDQPRLAGLAGEGIRAAAVPPDEVMSAPPVDRESGDTPLGPAAPPPAYQWPEVALWFLGTRITAQHREEVVSQIEQLRHFDYQLRRPTLADVAEEERYFSRYVPILGTSRHICGTSFSFENYRNWLSQRTLLARPGSYLFTWLQVEPIPPTNDWRLTAGLKPIVIEPEQIRLQLYAAIMAGFRGFGYWTRSSLEGDEEGAEERRLAIAELNLELELLEPLLASANLTDVVRCRIADPRFDPNKKMSRKSFDFPHDVGDPERETKQKLAEREALQKNQKLIPKEIEAAVFQGAYHKLVVVTWLGHDAQCVPGTLAGNDAKVLIPEPSECAYFWEVTTTGLRPLKKEKTPGGYQVTLPKLDQTAVILASSDLHQRDPIDQWALSIAPTSARISIDLAKAKLKRVRKIDGELTAQGHDQTDGRTLLFGAEQFLARAEAAFSQNDYNQARQSAADAMQLMRTLQYAEWNEAVLSQSFSSPLTSPYTVCYQTLPDHWRLIERIGRAADRPQENLLATGDFEDQDAIVAGWNRSQHVIEGVRAGAYLAPPPAAHQGRSCLQVIAGPVPKIDPPVVIPKAPFTVTSPPVPVRAGQVLYISGWIKLVTPVVGSLDGVTVHDSLGGMYEALRFTEAGTWQRFQMLRDVREDGEATLAVDLNGMGEVLVDDLRIIPQQEGPIRADGNRRRFADQKNVPARWLWNPLQNFRQQPLQLLDGAPP